ncbi:MAG: hypothetical protein PX481_22875 [Microcystis sp. M53603_WE2]|jgi:hypothetical protein|uniref:hypothetical protein n=1 Tax=unclassified Microcystis TaxID=2643300 RepID=UPI0022BFA955|nr:MULTISPECIES: hypothetical protein [unclassified Microcystis]MCE2661880.1 hypothetical protein [Microcystis sp. 53602_E8]MCZ8364044.1 hypothetical protein [Microcystis sp. LE19-251.1A]MCZ8025605.1 hypothetical protein [Microcystis sp. LE19-10.1B]MDJ0541466.1 hypothetical protein [Microcystis sp. M53603_WE2]MDJ0607308.1 hypothetical protein [Microcystis sp. M53602_WE12]
MSISDPTSQKASLTQLNRALRHFTDRHELTLRFAEYLNDDELDPHKILFFYGDGGNGKSLLLKFLLENCCKRFPLETWTELKTKTHPEIVEFIKTITDWERDFQFVPAALLDFESPAKSSRPEQPQENFDGLLILHNQLITNAARLGYKLSFPLYQFACILYLQQKGKLTNESVNRLFPSPELFASKLAVFLIKELPNALAAHILPGFLASLTSSSWNIITQDLGGDLSLYLQGRGLQKKDFQRITELDPDAELIVALPNFFAEDLKVAMQREGAPEKLVLFFDTHEAFWGEGRNQGSARFFKQDEWLRCLLSQLLELPQIVIVMAGREIPQWHRASYCSITADKLECRQVFNFQVTDALDYLQRVGIEDTQVQQSLIAYSSFDGDSVHPLLLGLCADLVRMAPEKKEAFTAADFQSVSETGEGFNRKLGILVERLLKYTDRVLEDAVYVLSACRAFNEDLYFHLGESLKCNPSHAAFDSLLSFSFVWQAEQQGEGWYRLHPFIRRFNHEQKRERTQAAHQVLERYYRERGNLAEALYHAYWQEPLRAKEEWIEVFGKANQQEDNELCQALAEIKKEIPF